jgi:hypothetical protein
MLPTVLALAATIAASLFALLGWSLLRVSCISADHTWRIREGGLEQAGSSE